MDRNETGQRPKRPPAEAGTPSRNSLLFNGLTNQESSLALVEGSGKGSEMKFQ
jgi:hypothetical protein